METAAGNGNQAPLLSALQQCLQDIHAPFYTPGHKRGTGISANLRELLGENVFLADLSELSELDNLAAPTGAIAASQQLAAQAFGAESTFFLVNGSTCGIEAGILATCSPGDKIILPRNVHTSVISGLILAGALPIFIQPECNSQLGLSYSIAPHQLEMTLRQHGDAKAVMVVYPTYEGVCGDIVTLVQLAHSYGVPLLVDEAHGSHFAFHPQLPISALAGGADLSVQSIHKTLGAMTQGSMLHINSNLIDVTRLAKALRIVQSSSPSYVLMAALDGARQQMAVYGQQLMSSALELADLARTEIAQIPGLSLLEPPQFPTLGFASLDVTRLTVRVDQLGITGFAADDILETEYGVRSEFSSLHYITFIITFGNTQTDIKRLVTGLTALAQRNLKGNTTKPISTHRFWQDFAQIPHQFPCTPRDAFFAATKTVTIETASGGICAETVCPYPPGIPILLPGELVTPLALEYLQTIKNMGGLITGCADISLQTLQILEN